MDETTDYDSLDLLIPEDDIEEENALTEHDLKMLEKIDKVAKQVDAIERELDRVARRIENQVARIIAIRWRNKSKYTRKELLLSTGRLAYDAGMIDENLMRQLFVLDTVLGHEQVRAKRREQVLRIKDLCEVAAKLRQRALRLEKLALSISSAVEWACEKTKQEPEKDKRESEAGDKQTAEKPAQGAEQESSQQQRESAEQEQQAATASQEEEPAKQKEDVEMKTERATESAPAANVTPSKKKKGKKSRTPQQPKIIPVTSGSLRDEQPSDKREKPAQEKSAQEKPAQAAAPEPERDVPMAAAAHEAVSTPAPKATKKKREDAAERSKEKEERISSPDFRTKYGRLPEWNPQFRESQGPGYVELSANLQGVDKRDLEIDIDGRMLIIRGVKKPGQDELFFSHIFGVRDDSYGWFERKFQIPEFLDINNADATFANGVLKVKIPKVEVRRSVPIQPRLHPSQDFYSPFDFPARARPHPSYGYSSRPTYSYGSPFSGFGFW